METVTDDSIQRPVSSLAIGSQLFDKYQPQDKGSPKVDHEFQALALEMIDHFDKRFKGQIWGLFHKPEYTVRIINDAWLAYKKRTVKTFPYFMGILKRNKLKINVNQ